MLSQFQSDPDLSAAGNLRWLFLLRNFLLAGASLILLVEIYIIDYPVPKDPLWATISVIAIVNSLTWYRLQYDYPVSELELFGQLVFDVVGITVMLYFTGGGTNPVAWFFLLPLIITATVLPEIYTWSMVGLTSICYTLLIAYHIPLPALNQPISAKNVPAYVLEMKTGFNMDLHVFAPWFGFLLIAGIVAYFVVKMTNTLREGDKKLSKIREQTLRDERVVALGTLAAGAAHEMGTPLGTMAILIHELEKDYPKARFKDLNSKMHILSEQVNRCKQALSVMSASAGEIRAESGHVMPLENYLNEVIEHWHNQHDGVKLERDIRGFQPTPKLVADRTLTHALVNVLNNAADVSPGFIALKARWNSSKLIIEVRDAGPGINPIVAESAGKAPVSTKEHGLGVGLFLARSTVDRIGGKIELSNLEAGGACTRIELPLLPMENIDAAEN